MMNGDDRHLLNELLAAQERREAVALAVVTRAQGSTPRHAGAKMLIYGDGRTIGSIGGGEMESRVLSAANEVLREGGTRLITYSLVEPQRGDPGVCGGQVDIFIEAYASPATLFILGCGHVGRALSSLGRWMGFRVVAYDDRAELASRENMPDADVLLTGTPAELSVSQLIDSQTYLALVTRNVELDRQLLPVLLDTPAAYIGVMGSRRRWEETRRLLVEDGVPGEKLARVVSPIGLELNAESPHEIAVSILAQIIMTRRGGNGLAMASTQTSGVSKINQ